jgi:hypothetical protein
LKEFTDCRRTVGDVKQRDSEEVVFPELVRPVVTDRVEQMTGEGC